MAATIQDPNQTKPRRDLIFPAVDGFKYPPVPTRIPHKTHRSGLRSDDGSERGEGKRCGCPTFMMFSPAGVLGWPKVQPFPSKHEAVLAPRGVAVAADTSASRSRPFWGQRCERGSPSDPTINPSLGFRSHRVINADSLEARSWGWNGHRSS